MGRHRGTTGGISSKSAEEVKKQEGGNQAAVGAQTQDEHRGCGSLQRLALTLLEGKECMPQ